MCGAIKQKKLVKLYYESDNGTKAWKIVEPYILAIKDNGAGNIFLAALPTAEAAKKIEDRITRHYLVEKMDIMKLEVLDETFRSTKN